MFPRKPSIRHLKSTTSNFNNDDLASSNDEPNDNEKNVVLDSSKDVFLIINFSDIEKVEDLHNNKDVEDIRHLSACSFFVTIFGPNGSNSIPIIKPTRVNIGNIWLFKPPRNIRFWIEIFSSKANCIHNSNLKKCLSNDMLKHLSRNYIFISSLGWSF
jgi:hypothetical protein